MKMKYKLIIYLLLLSKILFAQTNFDKQWMSGGGYNYKTSFNTTQATNILACSTKFRYFSGGHSNICDSNGHLILCSDGYNIYDSNLNYIDGGDTLVPKLFYNDQDGFSTYSQNSIFLPFDSGIYYLITPAMSDVHYTDYIINAVADSLSRACFDLLLYHKIDMMANGGLGKVVQKAIPLLTNVRTDRVRMIACKHANGKDWWLLKQATDTNMIYTFLVKQDTIEGPFIQGFAEPHFGKERGWANNYGQSVFNKEGTMYFTGCPFNSKLFYANFNRCTGIFSNNKVINIPIDSVGTFYEDHTFTGCAFSNNSRFLYIIKVGNIWQYDLNDPDSNTAWVRIAQNLIDLPNYQVSVLAYLGADHKIYIGNKNGLGNNMSVIDNPDVKGVGCGFCAQCFIFPNIGVQSPPCMPNYDLGADSSICWAVGVHEVVKIVDDWVVYPNPSSNKIFIKNAKYQSKKELYNSVGQLILTTKENEIDVSRYANGMYYIRAGNLTKKIIIE